MADKVKGVPSSLVIVPVIAPGQMLGVQLPRFASQVAAGWQRSVGQVAGVALSQKVPAVQVPAIQASWLV
jgi:hypothetical protein